MKHTPEPWKVQFDDRKRQYPSVWSPVRNPVGKKTLICHVYRTTASGKANAHRIAACVNGCAGLNPKAYRACVKALRLVLQGLTYKPTAKQPYSVWFDKMLETVQAALKQAQAKNHCQETR